MSPLLKRTLTDWFLLGMLSAVLLSLIFPQLGASGGILHLDQLTNLGIVIVFFCHGLGLGWKQLHHGISRWKLPVLIQTTTFLVFPLLALALNTTLHFWLPPALALGFFYLCALPSTMSSSVAMTATAHGNVPGALFNAALSSLLGLLLTPLWLTLAANVTQRQIPLGETVLKLALLLLLPVVGGLLVRQLLGDRVARWKSVTNKLDRSIILMIVLNSFSDSVQSGILTHVGAKALILTFLGASLLLAFALLLTTGIARWARLSHEDEAAAVFCGSKKSLAQGIPMAKVLFSGNPALGLIVLPIMLYHQIQLIVCSILADGYRRRAADLCPPTTS